MHLQYDAILNLSYQTQVENTTTQNNIQFRLKQSQSRLSATNQQSAAEAVNTWQYLQLY